MGASRLHNIIRLQPKACSVIIFYSFKSATKKSKKHVVEQLNTIKNWQVDRDISNIQFQNTIINLLYNFFMPTSTTSISSDEKYE
jgi:hypothetical protein